MCCHANLCNPPHLLPSSTLHLCLKHYARSVRLCPQPRRLQRIKVVSPAVRRLCYAGGTPVKMGPLVASMPLVLTLGFLAFSGAQATLGPTSTRSAEEMHARGDASRTRRRSGRGDLNEEQDQQQAVPPATGPHLAASAEQPMDAWMRLLLAEDPPAALVYASDGTPARGSSRATNRPAAPSSSGNLLIPMVQPGSGGGDASFSRVVTSQQHHSD